METNIESSNSANSAINDNQPTATPDRIPNPEPPPPPPPPKPAQPLPSSLIVGTVDLRTPDEEIEFQRCEKIVRDGWAHFAEVGAALMIIRDKELYKNEYPSFEAYCHERWGLGRTQTWRYVSAAQIQQNFALVRGMPLPECEAQVRPLVGLKPELAQEAWLTAVSWRPEGQVPGFLVKRAVKQVLKSQPATAASPKPNRQQRYDNRQAIKQTFSELLALLMGPTDREVLIGKLQALERMVNAALDPKKKRA